MTMNEIKKAIIASFKRQFGFGPTMKAIIPLESCGYSNLITGLCFRIGKIGYSFEIGHEVERADQYDYEEYNMGR